MRGVLGPWDNGLRIRAIEEVWHGPGLSLFGLGLDHTGQSVSIAKELTLEPRAEYESANRFAQLSMAAAKELMDDLWRAGVRPTDAVSGDATMQATKDHLADMRKLVAHYSKCGL